MHTKIIIIFVFFLCAITSAQDIQILADTDWEDTPWSFKIHQNESYYIKYHFVENEWFRAELMRIDENNQQKVVIDFDTLDRGEDNFYPRNIHLNGENVLVMGQYFTNFRDSTKEVVLLDYNVSDESYNIKDLSAHILYYQEMESVFKNNGMWYVLHKTPGGPVQLHKSNLSEETVELSFHSPFDFRIILPNLYITPSEQVFMLGHWGRFIKLDSLLKFQYASGLELDRTRRDFDIMRPSGLTNGNNVYAGVTYEKIINQTESYQAVGIVKFSLGQDTFEYEYIFEELDTDTLGFQESWGGFANLGDTLFYLSVNLEPCYWKYQYFDEIECTNQFIIYSINKYGEINWSRIFGGDAGYQVFDAVGTEDAGCVVTLERNIYGDKIQNIDAYYVKLDRNGNVNNNLISSTNNYEIEDLEVNSILIYPNPAFDFVSFKHHINKPVLLKIYDMPGCLRLSSFIGQNEKLNIETLPAGQYNCVFEYQDGAFIESQHLIKY